MASSRAQRRAWFLAAALFVAVSAVMLAPLGAGGIGPSWPHLDKVVHALAWLALAVALWPAVRASVKRSRLTRALAIVLVLGAWGVAIELLQGFVPHRSTDPWDALADVVGASLGVLCMATFEAVREARAARPALAEETEP